MKKSKPVFVKTYGKQKRRVDGWILPENHKQAFDTSQSTEDGSVFEPPKPKKTKMKKANVSSRPSLHPTRKKAALRPTESYDEGNTSNEENIMPRKKTFSVASGRAVRPTRRKAILYLKETSSDQQHVESPAFTPPKQSKTTRRAQRVSATGVSIRQRGQQVSVTGQGEESMSAPKPTNSFKRKTNSGVYPPSAGRFVTRRKRSVATKPPKPPKAVVISSSDDFSSGEISSSRIVRPHRRKKMLSAILLTSAEKSLNPEGTSSFTTNPFREISLNVSVDQSPIHCPRKPIFCSTPSAGFYTKPECLKPFPINDQSSIPPSRTSVNCPTVSTFQENPDSPEQSAPLRHSASVRGLHSEGNLQPGLEELQKEAEPHHHDASLSAVLYTETKSSSCSEEAKSHIEKSKTKDSGELPSINLISTDSESDFVSASAGLEWLIEALKENCLTKLCTVQLEQLDYLTVAQLCGQTTYSSCLEHSRSVHSHRMNEQSVDNSQTSLNLHLSVTNNEAGNHIQSLNNSEKAALVSDVASLADCSESAECSSTKASIELSESTHHTVTSFERVTDTQLSANNSVGESIAVKRCSVQIKKLDLSLLEHNGSAKKRTAGLSYEKSGNQDEHTDNADSPEDAKCSEEITERNRRSKEEKAALLKDKCRTHKLAVKLKRVTLSQLKENLQVKGAMLKSHTYTSGSSSDDQTKADYLSEADCYEDTSSLKVLRVDSTSCEDSSDKEVGKNTCSIIPKRKNADKEKKKCNVSTDRPGTTRKACVSGMSVTRWKNKSTTSTHLFKSRAGISAVDCSINDLISTQHVQPRDLLGGTMNLFTPVKASQLNLSSLLGHTHTWSRLKAAVSVHRKMVLSPRSQFGTPSRMEVADVSQDLFATPSRTPFPKRLLSQMISHHSLVACEDDDLTDAEKVYAECGQQHPLPWEECIVPHRMKQCVKIGEGTFGEVFSTTNASGDTVALKVIPIEGSKKVNGEDQKTFGEILHEIIISKELSSLKEKQHNQTHGFIGLIDLHCVKGCYPPDFLNTWDTFDKRKGSENDRPDFFEEDQLFIILEFEFGGADLENSNGKLSSLMVAKSILHQVTAALAVAEQELHFEHRDLHWGNVLVKSTRQKKGSFLLNGQPHSLETKGVLVRIIDYSLSRLEIDDLTVSCDISNDEELFMGQGDYQFDIYRMMRKENRNNWSNYHPYTNVLWLHYLCTKLLSMKYRAGRGAKDTREQLTRFHGNVLQYSSATEVLQNCPMF
ncbi:uncharacterized protein haspin [Parambassis ranga]|uniref:Serine/threonine-protein kinase haspin n=1 Tax=Parambassis ranga TaxID=210632 RepID=A0A6P7I3Z3_9TELE|nr:serine/threonine-protein kinase haspin [Parambassis ranga]